jgi:hypothetical protein
MLFETGFKGSWYTYFMYGGIAVILSWVTSGCRFGSRIQNVPDPDQITGYYEASPQNLTFYATTTNTVEKDAPVTSIPGEIGEVMTNPVALKVDDLSTGSARWISPVNRVALPVFVDPDLNLSLRGATQPVTLWDDSNCKTHLEIFESGKLVKTHNVSEIPGNPYPLSGKVQATFQVINQFKGDCVPTLQRMATCLDDINQCGESSPAENLSVQNQILDLFKPWFNAGLIAVSDIPDLVNFAYEVTYE